jgi:hypothetical protein
MVRVVIVDMHGKTVWPKDLSTLAELRDVVEQARGLIRECERFAREKSPAAKQGGVPYLT